MIENSRDNFRYKLYDQLFFKENSLNIDEGFNGVLTSIRDISNNILRELSDIQKLSDD